MFLLKVYIKIVWLVELKKKKKKKRKEKGKQCQIDVVLAGFIYSIKTFIPHIYVVG
jgi:hypothetical protein